MKSHHPASTFPCIVTPSITPKLLLTPRRVSLFFLNQLGTISSAKSGPVHLPISAAHGRLELLLGRSSSVDIKSSEEERRDDKETIMTQQTIDHFTCL